MKKLAFISLLCLSYSTAHSQAFRTIQANRIAHYGVDIANTHYQFTSKIDSSAKLGVDSVFYNYRQIYTNIDSQPELLDYSNTCLDRKSWLGTKILVLTNGNSSYFNKNDLPITINNKAVLGDSWMFFAFSDTSEIIATVSSIQGKSVLGTTDLVKEITLELRKLDGSVIANQWNGLTLQFSENNGFIKAYNFYEFPNDTRPYLLEGFSNPNQGAFPLTKEIAYNYQVGDVFHRVTEQIHFYDDIEEGIWGAKRYYWTTRYLKLINKVVNLNSYDYTFVQLTRESSSKPSFIETFAYDTITQILPFSSNFVVTGAVNEKANFTYVDSTRENRIVSYTQSATLNSIACYGNILIQINDYAQLTLLESELGLVHSKRGLNSERLVYYEKQGIENGTSDFFDDLISANKDESCDGLIQFQLADIGPATFLWDFGDGTTSTEKSPVHAYLDTGDYVVKVQISSPSFGVGLSTYANTIRIGKLKKADLGVNFSWSEAETCNSFKFVNSSNKTQTWEYLTWEFPSDTLYNQDSLVHIFDTTGVYSVRLKVGYHFCGQVDTTKLISVVNNVNVPKLNTCKSTGYSLTYGDGNMVGIHSFNMAGLAKINDAAPPSSCNPFICEPGQQIPIYIKTEGVAFPDYNQFTEFYYLWIDYGDDGDFQENELVASGRTPEKNFYPVADTIQLTIRVKDIIPNKPLRIRLGTSDNHCENKTVDYALYIRQVEPLAFDDSISSQLDQKVKIDILSNDVDYDEGLDRNSVDLDPVLTGRQTMMSTTDGTWTVDTNGMVTFTPTLGFNGRTNTQYNVKDNSGKISNIATITVTAFAPVAVADSAATGQNTPVSIDVTTNDSDQDGSLDKNTIDLDQSITGIQSTSSSEAGAWSVDSAGIVTFTPAPTFTGTTKIQYTINDNDTNTSNVTTIYITVLQTVSLPETETKKNLRISPNPFKDMLLVESNEMESLRVLNMLGQPILTRVHLTCQEVISTSEWASGYYVLELKFKNERQERVQLFKVN